MKVLFLSVTAGEGHNQTAKAIMDCVKNEQIECTMLDTFEYINPFLSESIDRGYRISTKFTPAVYGRIYRAAEMRERTSHRVSITSLMSALLNKKMINFLRDYAPDVIVCTHIFAAQIVSYLQKKDLNTISIGIVTDFTIHPFWEETELNYYITASDLLNNQMMRKGIPLDKVHPIGIPILTKFATKREPSEARRMLGIEDKNTIFVMSGSMGYGHVEDVIAGLDQVQRDFQIVSVCGNNKAVKRKIDNMKTKKKVYSYGFVDNVDLIMDASTCIVTKPGGLTVSESITKELPMILVNPIPGQEDRNVEFLVNNGMGIKVSKTYPIDEAIFQLLQNPVRITSLKEMMKTLGKPNATENLTALIKSL